MSAGDYPTRARELELALFEKIDSRLDEMAKDVRDVRERVIRMESQDILAKLTVQEERIRKLEEWKSRIAGQVALIIVPIAAGVGATIKIVIDLLATR